MPTNEPNIYSDTQLENDYGDLIMRLQEDRRHVSAAPASFKVNLRTKLRSHSAPSSSKDRPRPGLIGIPITLMIAILIATSAIWVTGQHPVSAAEIVRQATRIANDSAASGLQSYSGIQLNWMRNSYCDSCATQSSPLLLLGQDRIWFQSPALLRREMYAYTAPITVSIYSAIATVVPDQAGSMMASAVLISDGVTLWWYHIPEGYVEERTPMLTHPDSIPTDFSTLVAKLGQDNVNVTLLGTDTIADRATYVLSFTPKPDVAIWPNTTQIKSWIDKETYFQLGQEYLDKHGETLLKWQYRTFEVNPQLSPDLFKFSVPNGLRLVDLRASKDAAELALDWQNVASSAAYKVFKPVNVPGQLIAQRPVYGDSGGSVTSGSTQSEADFYVVGEEQPALVIIEDKSSEDTMLPIPARTENLSDNLREDAGRRTLVLDRDGTRIFIQADQQLLTKDALIDLAAKMELVPPS